MKDNVENHVNFVTNEVNMTTLAETCCNVFDCDEEDGILDDETHWVWEVAADVATWWESPGDED